jgi:C1A family cysteine protease
MERSLGAFPSPINTNDFLAESIYPERDFVHVPETLDLRPNLRPIKDQGPYSTCAAQTAACIKEYQEKLDVKLDADMSAQFVYYYRANKPNDGMYGKDVMRILTERGCCLESTYKYNSKDVPTQKAITEATNYKCKNYALVNTIATLKVALYKNGPCYIAFPCYNYGGRFWKQQNKEQIKGGHAVTVVGYDKNGFIIRNSWGTDWCNNGYTVYPYGDFGLHYEVWTIVDETSSVPLSSARKRGCFGFLSFL